MKYLFIGGSKDGEWLNVGNINIIDFLILDSVDQDFEPSFTKESYRKETFGCQHHQDVKRFQLFINYDLTVGEAMQMLIEGYKNQ